MWNPESGTILPVESRIIGFGICNLTNDWSPEFKSHHQRLEFSAWNPESIKSNLESNTVLGSLTFEWSTQITREIFFGTFQLLASISPWKLTFSPGHRVFVLLTSTLFLQLHHEVSCQLSMLVVGMLIVCIIYRKWSNGRPRGVYIILRVQEGGPLIDGKQLEERGVYSYKCNQLSKTHILLSKILRVFKNGEISSPYFWYIWGVCFRISTSVSESSLKIIFFVLISLTHIN